MRALAGLIVIATVAGCHAAPTVPQLAQARVAQHAAVRDTGNPVADATAAAQNDLAAIDAALHALALDTARGRKITPERDKILTVGLAPLLQQLDADTAAIAARLAAAGAGGDASATAAQAELDRHHPLAGEALGADPNAADMLYRVTQYRLKLGALVELGLRVAAATPAPAP